MDVHLRDLRYFVAVAEELSFTRAAERLHLSQPALSRQIRLLETELGGALFDRTRRSIAITPAGAALLSHSRDLLAGWQRAHAEVAEAIAADARRLRVGTLTSIGRFLYPSVVDIFAALLPGWRIDLHSFSWDEPTAGLRDGTTDAAFLWLPVPDQEIAHHVLATERRFVAMSTRHRLSGRASVSFAEIADEPLAALPPGAGALRAFWLAEDARTGRPARIAAEVNSADETFETVASGVACALLAEGNAAIYTRPGITCLPVDDLPPARLAVGWRRADHRPAVAAFVRACLEAGGRTAAARG